MVLMLTGFHSTHA